MGRYYFHVRNGTSPLAEDPDGDELANLAQVRAHALNMARDLIARTCLDSVRNWFDCTYEVMDERGGAVMRVPFTDTVPFDEDTADDAA